MRILLVDDNYDLRITLSALLQSAGFDVRDAADGPSALSILQQSGPFDALITDVVMPGMSGIDLAHEARRHCRGLTIILMSGYVPPTQALPKNWQFVQKPCNLTDLLIALRKVDDEPGTSGTDSSKWRRRTPTTSRFSW
jgi:CheY-like chemotaxis protein